ncbi:MAG: nucleotidyltransferase substrate binding protein [Clostridia bacterium]|nr:nucleotidyltransferase substrate binding protein [Clostridia bacterium]
MQRIENKLNNLTSANKRLREAIVSYRAESENTLYRDALIQRFEFTFELAWKTLTEVLREQGIVLAIISPKSVLKEAYGAGYIQDEKIWMQMIEDRNAMSHIYQEEEAGRIAEEICMRYGKMFTQLLKALL